jgi:putative transposase
LWRPVPHHRGIPFVRKCSDAIEAARIEFEFDLWAYVFMPDHSHVIVRPRQPDYDIALIRKAIKEPVGRKALKHLRVHAPHWLARVERRRGSRSEYLFWQSGGGYDRNINEPATLERMIDYIHLNPVRRSLVRRGWEWKWSSACWYAGTGTPPIRLDPIPPEWVVHKP